MDTKRIYVTVALDIHSDANEQEVIAELEYNFDHDDLVDAEIMEEDEHYAFV